ncbi:MAG: hypothetical protein H6817_11015 [Phycisphaerales bacterium]|nr:hypothetical protein [Phycisphaerales bacterium]
MRISFTPLGDGSSNEVLDYRDITGGTSDVCQPNGIPDFCEPDFDHDEVVDACDLAIDNDGDFDLQDFARLQVSVRP